MLLDLAREIDVDLSRSWMVGDTESDVAAGRAAGCRTALIGSTSAAVGADLVAPSLDQVSRRIARPKNIATAL
jgi:phosphoglycolate phosphatase-like HAD superfamily hydrolase